MLVPIVRVVSGTEQPVGEGINQPIRCIVRYPDESIKVAIVKRLSAQGVSAEIFCALLLRGWGLKVPEPAVVDEEPIAFASLDEGYPNLNQRIGWSEALPGVVKHQLITQGSRLVASFADTPRALSADEAIANRDRNFGNILWDGNSVAWIDHERALGIARDDIDQNKLVQMVLTSQLNHTPVLTSAVAISLSLGAQAITAAENACNGLDVASFAAQVSQRLGSLAGLVLKRFPQPEDLLSQDRGQH